MHTYMMKFIYQLSIVLLLWAIYLRPVPVSATITQADLDSMVQTHLIRPVVKMEHSVQQARMRMQLEGRVKPTYYAQCI